MSKSSQRWLNRQRRDPFVRDAHRQGFRSRAAYKLQEIDERHRLFRPGMRVVDLGAAPGSFSQYAALRVQSGGGLVVAADRLDMAPIEGVVLVQGDLTDSAVLQSVREHLHGPADLVISDMAPNLSGNRIRDQAEAIELAEIAQGFALEVLRTDGVFLVKLFQGDGIEAWFKELKRHFVMAKWIKPSASRGESREVYALGKGLREIDAAMA